MAKKYFVTGVTGAIGSALIPLLLEDRNSQIWALMRAVSEDDLKNRLEALISFWEMDLEQSKDARRRIIPLLGDADKCKFALSEGIYTKIANQCTHIIHCAGVVRMNLPLAVARGHALGSAQNIVELALACQKSGSLQKVEYVSTVGVAGRMPGLVPESWITQPREFHNTYEQSKAEAEDYLHDQIKLYDLPVTIHRPSMVVGDSKTGKVIHFQIFYYLCEFISGRRTFGILPHLGDAILDIVPVDYVAQVIKWSSEQETNTVGKIFHLCSGPGSSIRVSELQKVVRILMKNYAIKLPSVFMVPSSLFKFFLKVTIPLVNETLRRPMKALPIFVSYLADRQVFNNTNTRCFLDEHLGPRFIPANDYLQNVLNKYLITQER